MATRLPSALPRRPTAPLTSSSPSILSPTTTSSLKPSHTPLSHTPSRPATLIRRPKRPYTFTQLVQQSDGSTYTMRTTSPYALYKSTKDTRNHLLWQPSDRSLKSVEVDEAGKLAAFRSRFGRGWDIEKSPEVTELEKLEAAAEGGEGGKSGAGVGKPKAPALAPEPESETGDALSDLVARYAIKEEPAPKPRRGKGPAKK
ncbi:uncharacterized protein F4807DRAFT_446666 [Annulohypoxylon truncatum]|uniref:uncharacterized protein n=1 Tax=Annulohypoxylon truncatum TaxID=327061 RepID=UPI0020086205|nr:uncharacterized protein F4807DRAFT_446666 [Annulohypoxylon truncatum]KAI1204621.1 hypothetical protein F4807DRAFT_446666 [Annulohypoxylon truncatum]